MQSRVAFFGQSEKGKYHVPYVCHSLYQLVDTLGNPPEDSQGLFFAIQSILYEREILFFRVKEEGYSLDDYILGLKFLRDKDNIKHLDAIGIPGVGNPDIIEELAHISHLHKSLIITTEKDLYDYLTSL